MAEVTGLRNNALPYPVYGAPYGVTFPILDADGDLVTGAASLDSEVSKNGDTFADCTNEATEIATSSGFYYLLLTATEMTADVVTVIVKTGTAGAKTTPLVLYPKKLPAIRSGTSQGGATGSITLDASASAVDDAYNGCLVVGTLDATVEARIITDYVGSTKVASVTPNWVTTPDSDDTFIIYLPDGVQVPTTNVIAWLGAAAATPSVAGVPEVDLTHVAGSTTNVSALATNVDAILTDTGTTLQGELDGIQADTEDIQSRLPAALTAGGNIKADALAVSGDATAADTLELFAEALDQATGQLDSGSLANGTITAASIASDAITDAKVASDVTIASVTGAVGSVTGAVGSVTGNVGGNVTGSVGSVVGAVGSVTGNVGGNVTGTVGGFTTAAKAEIQTEAEDALVAHRLDELLNADSDIDGAAPPTVGSVVHEMLSKTAGSFTFDQTTDSLEALRDRGDAAWTTATGFSTLSQADIRTAVGLGSANLDTQLDALPTAAENADAVWDEATSGHTTSGTFGEQAKTDIDAILEDTGTTLQAEVDGIQADTEDIQTRLPAALVGGRIDATVDATGMEAGAVGAIADGVWDEATSGHTSSGSYGDKFGAHLPAVLKVVIGSGSTTTSIVLNATTGIDGGAPSSTNDFYNGRILIFTSGALAGQATSVEDYVGSTVTLTVVALTGAPASGVTAVIV